jgi:hypothetical protein
LCIQVIAGSLWHNMTKERLRSAPPGIGRSVAVPASCGCRAQSPCDENSSVAVQKSA